MAPAVVGITFNYGLLLGWTSINEEISLIPVIFYISAIFWTLGYDTIYGFQDIEDDEIIELNQHQLSLNKPQKYFYLYVISFSPCFVITGIKLNFNYFLGAIAVLFHLLVIQIMSLIKKIRKMS